MEEERRKTGTPVFVARLDQTTYVIHFLQGGDAGLPPQKTLPITLLPYLNIDIIQVMTDTADDGSFLPRPARSPGFGLDGRAAA